MIEVTSIKGQTFILNSSLIYWIEESPDTIIMLVDGKTMRVQEPGVEITNRIVAYQRRIHQPGVLKSST
jgi:flagellar protein FlbD